MISFRVTTMFNFSAVLLALVTMSGRLSFAQLTTTRQNNLFEVNPFSVGQREALTHWFSQLSQKLDKQSHLTHDLSRQFVSAIEEVVKDQNQVTGNHSSQLQSLTKTVQQVMNQLDELSRNQQNRSDCNTLQLGYLQGWFDQFSQKLDEQSQCTTILDQQFDTISEQLQQNQQHCRSISNQSSQLTSVTGALQQVESRLEVFATQTSALQNDSLSILHEYLQDWFDQLSQKLDQGSQFTFNLGQQVASIAELNRLQNTSSHYAQLHSLTETIQQVANRLSELIQNPESHSINDTVQMAYFQDWFDQLSQKLDQQGLQLADNLNHIDQTVQLTDQLIGARLQTIEQSQQNQTDSHETHLELIREILQVVNQSQHASDYQTVRLQLIEEELQQVSNKFEEVAQTQRNRNLSQTSNCHDLTQRLNSSFQMFASRLEVMDRKQSKATGQSTQQFNNVTQSVNELRAEIRELRRALKDSSTDGSSRGGILIQQHYNGTNFFNRTWAEYKAGFGDVTGNYWLGNELMHHLTKDGRYKLLVDLQAKNNSLWYWAEYQSFRVSDESTQYRLEIGGYSGTAGDSLSKLNGTKFSTKDRDNDLNHNHCAAQADLGNGGGFWYGNCTETLINSPSQGKLGFVWDRLPIGSSRTADRRLRVIRLTLQLK